MSSFPSDRSASPAAATARASALLLELRSTPRVSIGVPVYNGGRYLARALDALLAQTFGDFELIITDNASTDDTEAICRRYAARDRRVRYFRARVNLGIARNFNWCFELSRGEYFKWNAADDMIAPTFLEKCVTLLDEDRSVVLAFAQRRMIDELDRPIRVEEYDVDADDPRPHVRFSRMIHIDHRRHAAQEIYGLIRRCALRRTALYQPYVRSDSILLARLALIGRFRRIEQPLLLNREHADRSVRLTPGQRGAAPRTRLARWIGTGPVPPSEFWNPALAGRFVFPEWRILAEYMRFPALAPPTLAQRLRCRLTWAGFAVRHTPKLARDLLIAAEHAVLGLPGAASPSPIPSGTRVPAA